MSKTIAAVIILAFLCGFTYLAYSEDDGEKVYTIPRGVYLDPDGNEGAVEITLRGKDGRALTVEEALEHAKTIQVTGERFDGGVTTPGGSKIDEGIGYIMPDGSLEGVQDVYGNPTTIEEHIKLLEEMQKAERGEKRASEFSEISEAQQTLLEHKKAIEERKSARKFKVTGQKKPRFSEFYEVEEMVEEVEKSEEQ